jgi:tetratricopeptide (TPR) repeat protein
MSWRQSSSSSRKASWAASVSPVSRAASPVVPHLATARVRNDLAVLLKYTGGFDEAAELYAAACEVLTARLGADDPEVASVLHNIGGLAHAAGRPADGEAAARRSVEIRDAAVGAEHPDSAGDSAALAAILAATGRHGEARALLDAALAVFERALGDDHYEVAVTLGNLAALDAQRGDLASAERRLRRALAIKELTIRTSPSSKQTSTEQLRSPRQSRRTAPDAIGDRTGLHQSSHPDP